MIPHLQIDDLAPRTRDTAPALNKVRAALIELFSQCKKEEKINFAGLAQKHKVGKGMFPTYLAEMGVIQKAIGGKYTWLREVPTTDPSFFVHLATEAIEYQRTRISGHRKHLTTKEARAGYCGGRVVELNPGSTKHTLTAEECGAHSQQLYNSEIAVKLAEETDKRKVILAQIEQRSEAEGTSIDFPIKKSEARLMLIALAENQNPFLVKFCDDMSERLFNHLF